MRKSDTEKTHLLEEISSMREIIDSQKIIQDLELKLAKSENEKQMLLMELNSELKLSTSENEKRMLLMELNSKEEQTKYILESNPNILEMKKPHGEKLNSEDEEKNEEQSS